MAVRLATDYVEALVTDTGAEVRVASVYAEALVFDTGSKTRLAGTYVEALVADTRGTARVASTYLEVLLSTLPPPPVVTYTIVVTPANTTTNNQTGVQYTAIKIGSDGSQSTPNVVWTTTAGTIDSTGYLIPDPKVGVYTVTATEVV